MRSWPRDYLIFKDLLEAFMRKVNYFFTASLQPGKLSKTLKFYNTEQGPLTGAHMYSLNVPLWQVSATFSLGRFIFDRPEEKLQPDRNSTHVENVILTTPVTISHLFKYM